MHRQDNTLCIIIEQSKENVLNMYNKMWDIMRKYDIPGHIINNIKQTYEGYICQTAHEGKLTDCIKSCRE
jgi:hypothetical protein